ncbi:MAG: peptidoglycan editing factor PgeF [Planctomycetes bacterium]|nr:peptidoglycan editing factor PgeF [Planctomycetota bacterium]
MQTCLPFLTVPDWRAHRGLVHAFLGRRGGFSAPPYDSLNASTAAGDKPEDVRKNWCEAKKALGIHSARVTTMRQIHGCDIAAVDEGTGKEAGEADAMVTDRPGCWLAVLTADCVPILLVHPGRRIAAAVHAGWRGSAAGIAVRAVQHLVDRYGIRPGELSAALGPAIGPCCYTVGHEAAEAVAGSWPRLQSSVLHKSPEGLRLDLRGLNRFQLLQAGLDPTRLHDVGHCTACSPGDFFSHRRVAGRTGRQISLVGWMPS